MSFDVSFWLVETRGASEMTGNTNRSVKVPLQLYKYVRAVATIRFDTE